MTIANRFDHYLPIVVDVETGGLEPQNDGLLELAGAAIALDDEQLLTPSRLLSLHVRPHENSRLTDGAFRVHGINPHDPNRTATDEPEACQQFLDWVRKAIRDHGCKRAILVGHNAPFDLAVVNAMFGRCKVKQSPFHPFSCIDTVSLGVAITGQRRLPDLCKMMGVPFSHKKRHSALYDVKKCAEVFCAMLNTLTLTSAWPPSPHLTTLGSHAVASMNALSTET